MLLFRACLTLGWIGLPASLATALPVVWEFSGTITRTTIGPQDFDPGFRAGAVVEGRLEFDPGAAEVVNRQPAGTQFWEGGGPCADSDIRCAYQMPAYLTVSIDDHLAQGSLYLVTIERDSAIHFTINPFSYDGVMFHLVNSTMSLSVGYGTGLRVDAIPSDPPPEDYSHFFSIHFNSRGVGGTTSFGAGDVTRLAVAPEPSAMTMLVMVFTTGLLRSAGRRSDGERCAIGRLMGP